MDFDTAFPALGRLDGQLTHSPAAQPWLIKARLEAPLTLPATLACRSRLATLRLGFQAGATRREQQKD